MEKDKSLSDLVITESTPAKLWSRNDEEALMEAENEDEEDEEDDEDEGEEEEEEDDEEEEEEEEEMEEEAETGADGSKYLEEKPMSDEEIENETKVSKIML